MRKRQLTGTLALPVLAFVLALTGCEEENTIFDGFASAAVATSTETVALAYDTPLPLFVACTTRDGAVTVTGTPGLQTISVTVTRAAWADTEDEANDRLQRIRYTAALDGATLRLEFRSDEQDADVLDHASVAFAVRIPSDAVLSLRTSNGAIRIAGVTGDVGADTSNGRIEAIRIAGDLAADTSNGELRIEDVSGNVSATTSNGAIAYSGRPGDGTQIALRTSNGSITVRIPNEAAVALSAETSHGRIETDLDLVGDTAGDEWDAQLNPPAATTVRARTSNGSIRLLRLP